MAARSVRGCWRLPGAWPFDLAGYAGGPGIVVVGAGLFGIAMVLRAAFQQRSAPDRARLTETSR
ncbi:MAG: hypothetical protein R3D60_05820 [Paracoccaceae bacterium]